MAILASRLTSTGNLLTRGEFDEVTTSSIRLTIDNQYAAFLDEVSLQGLTSVQKRETSTGTLLVSGYFDEVTLRPGPTGQQAFTTPGTFSWTAPTGVYSVSVVCIGGGGGGLFHPTFTGGGGAGGGLGWKNNISVNPGETYTVVVGAGGTSDISTGQGSPTAGGPSYFINLSTVAGLGGDRNYAGTVNYAQGGNYVGDGGGKGGTAPSAWECGGGAGAGGYSGQGGQGGGNSAFAPRDGSAGVGGAAGGGAIGGFSNGTYGAAGGGVGIYGAGANGAGGTYGGTYWGQGGSGGTSGSSGGLYGGGAVGNGTAVGSSGAVRIIWGDDRSFPSTRTADL
jgi:hypothetical protein